MQFRSKLASSCVRSGLHLDPDRWGLAEQGWAGVLDRVDAVPLQGRIVLRAIQERTEPVND
jgi:hypothetical protein